METSVKSNLPTTIREWAEMIKFEHTVFALPFALSGLILAAPGLPPASVFFWTILAFAGARAAAMTLNRLIDSKIDALNPQIELFQRGEYLRVWHLWPQSSRSA
jgi:4-hydroxybenzoate polyprenyltransferase